MNIKAKHILYVGAFIVLTLIGIFAMPKNDEILDESAFVNDGLQMSGETIYVHIIGAINNPGIKEIPKYTRLFELIEISGGTTENADVSRLNLASVLKDEQKIVVPEIIIESDNNQTNSLLIKSSFSNTNTSQIVNINSSSKDELTTLPGIGESTAQKIIDYRNNNGQYNDIEEIKNVSRHRRSKI